MFQIQIPNPCHEDWEEMSPTQKGAFCKVCSKEVLDFTSSSQTEIKDTVMEQRNPCVRILQSQMDEMNFQEWFRSLQLRKRIKYLFLFSLLIAAQNIQAQDAIQPQKVHLDSTDVNHLDSSAIADIPITDDENALTTISLDPFIWSGAISISDGWNHPLGGVCPSEIVSVSGGIVLFTPNMVFKDPYEIDFQDQIVIGDEIFSFATQDDSLFFKSVLPEATQIFLSIVQDRLGKAPYPPYNEVFESPLQLEEGEQIIKIPIHQYVNGSYTIKIKTKKGEGIGRIMYW